MQKALVTNTPGQLLISRADAALGGHVKFRQLAD
jgi:hypothetical protein